MNKQQSTRLDSIDILRGISIFLMVLVHMGVYWLDYESKWLVAFIFIVVNYCGTSQFVFTSGVGFIYSWRISEEKSIPYQINKRRSLSRTSIMLIIAFVYNIFAIIIRDDVGIEGLWFWSILQCIAISRLIGTFIVRYSIKIRMILYFLLVALNTIIINWMEPHLSQLDENVLASIVFYLFYNPLAGDIIIIFFAFFIMGTIMGDIIFQVNKNASNIFEKRNLLKKWTIIGSGILLLGILSGLEQTTMDHWNLIPLLNLPPNVNLTTLPKVFSINSFSWAFACSGIHIILICGYYYLIDEKKRSIRPWLLYKKYGVYSLTIYFIHYIFLILPFAFDSEFSLSYLTIWPYKIVMFLILLFIIHMIEKYTGGKASFEYIVKKGGKTLLDYFFLKNINKININNQRDLNSNFL